MEGIESDVNGPMNFRMRRQPKKRPVSHQMRENILRCSEGCHVSLPCRCVQGQIHKCVLFEHFGVKSQIGLRGLRVILTGSHGTQRVARQVSKRWMGVCFTHAVCVESLLCVERGLFHTECVTMWHSDAVLQRATHPV